MVLIKVEFGIPMIVSTSEYKELKVNVIEMAILLNISLFFSLCVEIIDLL